MSELPTTVERAPRARAAALARRALARLAPFAAGILGTVLVVGRRALDPTTLGWLSKHDPAAHYLGWAFFRDAPWTFPLGASPDYGLEIASSVLYTDSIPLLALFFKPLSGLLPGDFQYFGLWIAACLVLQGYFAWRLVGLATESSWVRVLGSGLFVFSPPMLWRLRGHEALAGHWIVLAALLLALGPRRRSHAAWWAALGACAAVVHLYLLAMVMVLWAADWARGATSGAQALRRAAGEALLVPGAVLAALWQAGFFLVSSGKQADGFGYYRMNLQSPLDSDGWSFLLKDLASGPGEYEGFNFLGLGLLLLVAFAVPAVLSLRERRERLLRREWLFLGLGLLLLLACAASNKVGLGDLELGYPIPKPLRPLTGFVRSSGRMFWPVFYAVALLAVAAVVRAYGARVATILLALALVAQIADTRAGWSFFRAKVKGEGKPWPRAPLRSAFWDEAARHYRKLRALPPSNVREHFAALGYYAARHRLATDIVYLARIDTARQEELERKARETLALARFDPDTLYVLQDEVVPQLLGRIPEGDLLASVDGLWVVAPRWLAAGRTRPADAAALSPDAALPLDHPIAFRRGAPGVMYLASGWSGPEAWGVWSAAREATLRLPVDGSAERLRLLARPYLPAGAAPLEVHVSVDGVRGATWRFPTQQSEAWYELALPRRDPGTRTLAITLSFSRTLSPAAAAESGDTRELALALLAACAERRGCPREVATPP